MSRVPEPPAALQSELSRWDSAYRHGSEEKFVELERLADELLTRYPDRDNRARIEFQVAHVAVQSGLDKHIERLRKYARKSAGAEPRFASARHVVQLSRQCRRD